MIPLILALIWIAGSIAVGLLSRNRAFGFWGGFLFSMLLSPIIMILVLMLTQTKPKKTRRT